MAEKLHIGAVVFSDPAGDRINLTGGARVAMLVRVYRREDIGDVVCHAADMYHQHRALTWDDIDWDRSGIPGVAAADEGRTR